MPDIGAQIRDIQRELLRLKAGMFGGSRSHFDTTAYQRTFTGVTNNDLVLRVEFPMADFPVMVIRAELDGSILSNYTAQRTGRYEWTLFMGGDLLPRVYMIECTCLSEQEPTWSLS